MGETTDLQSLDEGFLDGNVQGIELEDQKDVLTNMDTLHKTLNSGTILHKVLDSGPVEHAVDWGKHGDPEVKHGIGAIGSEVKFGTSNLDTLPSVVLQSLDKDVPDGEVPIGFGDPELGFTKEETTDGIIQKSVGTLQNQQNDQISITGFCSIAETCTEIGDTRGHGPVTSQQKDVLTTGDTVGDVLDYILGYSHMKQTLG